MLVWPTPGEVGLLQFTSRMTTDVTIAPPSYEFLFQKPTMFPKAVEKPLRAALLAAEKAEYQESEAHFQRYAYSSPFLVTA